VGTSGAAGVGIPDGGIIPCKKLNISLINPSNQTAIVGKLTSKRFTDV
jgi:hypothetical protein